MNKETDILLSRYFGGEASEEELGRIDRWLAESGENEKYFDQLTRIYQQSAMMPPMPEPDTEKALADFKAYMRQNQHAPEKWNAPEKRIFRLRPAFLRAAAAVVLLVGTAAFFLLHRPADRPAELILLAAADSPEICELSDEAVVVLSPNSEISYSPDNKNKLELRGKAVFTVQPEQEKKLTVQAGETFVQDIGTIFTVTSCDANGQVLVEVADGEVLFFTLENAGLRIGRDEAAFYNPRSKQFGLVSPIIFEAAPLSEAVAALETRFGIRIRLQAPHLSEIPISASFDKFESVSKILEITAETLLLRAAEEEDGSFILMEN